MADVFDYLDWRGDISFSEVGLCEIDSLILSMICYMDLDGIVPPTEKNAPTLFAAAKQFMSEHKGEQIRVGAVLPSEIAILFSKAAKSRRFSSIRLVGYENKVDTQTQIQFAALTYILGDGNIFVTYRGTDDSIVGWKEDFNMSFMSEIPAQSEAVRYLEEAAERYSGGIICGGHSKGGNLAVYATVKAKEEVRKRVVRTYNLDGPGFSREFIDSGEYQTAKGRISTLLPETAVVGMLLEHEETYEVVKSKQYGIWQHIPIYWELLGAKFIRVDSVSEGSKIIDRTLKSWLSQMDMKQREEFVDALYEILVSTNIATLSDFATEKVKLLKAWSTLSEEHRALVLKSIRLLVKNIKLR